MVKNDIFEDLADIRFKNYYSWEIEEMLQKQPLIEVAKFIRGDVEGYGNSLQAKIVELIIYNRIKSEHSAYIIKF